MNVQSILQRETRNLSTALRRPEVRARILEEHAAAVVSDFPALIHSGFDRMYPLADRPDYEPTPDQSIGGQARATGRDPREVLYDLLLEADGQRLLYLPLMNYARGNLDDVREMITSPDSIFGLSDAGAHCNAISDATFPTTAIAHWTRDRTRGEGIDIEYIVHQQTQRTRGTSAGTTEASSRPAISPTSTSSTTTHSRCTRRSS
jgi:N-acyl-D-aspartate/D-glutamate deacylase